VSCAQNALAAVVDVQRRRWRGALAGFQRDAAATPDLLSGVAINRLKS
jgi:hypothetical protein